MTRFALMLTVLCVAGSFLGGCQSARVTAPPLTQQVDAEGEGDQGRLEFWHALPETGVVSNDDALHALTLYFDGQDAANGYDQRVAAFKERGWLPDNFNAPANEAVKRGTVAVAIVQALEIDGGIAMRLLGPSPRYATRELAYMQLFPLSSPQQTFSGVQIVELISKVEDWQKMHAALELPQPPIEGEGTPPEAITDARSRRLANLMTARRQRMIAMIMAVVGTPTMFAQAAQPEAPAADAAPADPNALPVVVTAVNGLVQVRTAEGQPWQVPQVGQKLTTGAEFRTGPRSSVQFTVGSTQKVTLDRLGTVKIIDALRQADGSIATDVGMKYGRSTLQVQAAGVEHQSRIRSPGAVLAVRGSIGSLEDIGGTLRAAGLEGDVAWARETGRFIVLPPNSEHEGDDTATGENRLADGTYNPTPFGTTPVEELLFGQFNNGTFQTEQIGTEVFGQQDGMEIDHGGEQPPPVLTIGDLFMFVDFTSVDAEVPADVDLRLRTPGNAVITASQPDPMGLLIHSGDMVSPNNDVPASESISTNSGESSPEVRTGSYRATLTNNGPAGAGFNFQAFFNDQLISSGIQNDIPSGATVIYDFEIGVQTVEEGSGGYGN